MKRVMLKISGEVLGGPDGTGADSEPLLALCEQLEELIEKGIQVAVVVGGGNFWRFRDNKSIKIPRSASDTIGMMATIMNARLLAEALKSRGTAAHALAAHADPYFAEAYVPAKGKALLDRGEIVICGGGTGNPYFTTDSAAALRALELECDALLKATKVDGVYDKDPVGNPDAKFYEKLTYNQALQEELGVMDLTAIVLCKENKLPIHVFNMQTPGNLVKVATGEAIGSTIN